MRQQQQQRREENMVQHVAQNETGIALLALMIKGDELEVLKIHNVDMEGMRENVCSRRYWKISYTYLFMTMKITCESAKDKYVQLECRIQWGIGMNLMD